MAPFQIQWIRIWFIDISAKAPSRNFRSPDQGEANLRQHGHARVEHAQLPWQDRQKVQTWRQRSYQIRRNGPHPRQGHGQSSFHNNITNIFKIAFIYRRFPWASMSFAWLFYNTKLAQKLKFKIVTNCSVVFRSYSTYMSITGNIFQGLDWKLFSYRTGIFL